MLFVALVLSLTLFAVTYSAAEEIRSIHSLMKNPSSLEEFQRMTSMHAVPVATAAVSNNLREGSPNLEAAAPTSYFGYQYYSASTTCGGASSYGMAIGLNTCFLSNDYTTINGVDVYYKSVKYTQSGSAITQSYYSDTACNTLVDSGFIPLVCYPTSDSDSPTAPATASASYYSTSSLYWPANGFTMT